MSHTKQQVCRALTNKEAGAVNMAFDFARQQNSGLTPEQKLRVNSLERQTRKYDVNESLIKILCRVKHSGSIRGGGRRTRRAKRASRRTRHAKRQ